MPITEISAVLNRRNSSGDTTVIYPITKVDNINGALPISSGGTGAIDAATARVNLSAAPVITYGTTDILAGSTSEKADGAMHFVYVTKNGVWDHVKSIFITIDGVWKLVCDIVYSITTNLTGVTGVSSNPTTISDDGTVEMTFTANAGYTLPDTVSVSGATSKWDKSTGKLTLSDPKSSSGEIAITITAEKIIYSIATNLTGVTGASSNLTTITVDETVSMIFTANAGYTLADAVSVTGASYTWDKDTGILKIYDVTGDVIISVVSEKIQCSITVNLTNATGDDENDSVVYYGDSVELTFTADTGYGFTDSVTVTGAGDYTWDKDSGKLTLSDINGDVTIDIESERIAYSIKTAFIYVTCVDDVPSTMYYGESVTLNLKANEHYTLPSIITVSGASYEWDSSTGTLTLSDPTSTNRNVFIYISGSELTKYKITTLLSCTTAAEANQSYVYVDETASLSFSAFVGYDLPDSIKVTNASYTWNSVTGSLEISNVTGSVTIKISSTELTDCIKFCGDEGEFTLEATNYTWDGTVQYSTDKSTWSTWEDGSAISSSNNRLYLRGYDNTTFSNAKFVLSDKASCGGNLNTLLQYDDPPVKLSAKYCYQHMFNGCTNLTTAPKLPATTLTSYCYYRMFTDCTSLTEAPELPAESLVLLEYCYADMFYGCTSLTKAPELPATIVGSRCYEGMFSGCTSLIQAPELPATSIGSYGYASMFEGCSNLYNVYNFPDDLELSSGCCRSMFKDCTSLYGTPALPATTLANSCYYQMFYGCTSLKVIQDLPATTLANSCYYGMFYGCTSLTSAPSLPATTLADSCYYEMFTYCTALGSDSKGVPPELPATTLADRCYAFMFYGCTSIKLSAELDLEYLYGYTIPSSGTGTDASDSLVNMFNKTGGNFKGTPYINTTYYVMDGDSPLEKG